MFVVSVNGLELDSPGHPPPLLPLFLPHPERHVRFGPLACGARGQENPDVYRTIKHLPGSFTHQIFIECRGPETGRVVLPASRQRASLTPHTHRVPVGKVVRWPDGVYMWLVTEIWLTTQR